MRCSWHTSWLLSKGSSGREPARILGWLFCMASLRKPGMALGIGGSARRNPTVRPQQPVGPASWLWWTSCGMIPKAKQPKQTQELMTALSPIKQQLNNEQRIRQTPPNCKVTCSTRRAGVGKALSLSCPVRPAELYFFRERDLPRRCSNADLRWTRYSVELPQLKKARCLSFI